MFSDYTKQFFIRTDASKKGLGGVLLQVAGELERPIHFVSRSLSRAERNYSITDLEGTAVHYCVKQFKFYIEGNPYETIVYTDHKPLVGLFNNKEPNNARHARWCIDLSMLKVIVKYEPGKKNALADSLSRLLPIIEENNSKVTIYNVTSGLTEETCASDMNCINNLSNILDNNKPKYTNLDFSNILESLNIHSGSKPTRKDVVYAMWYEVENYHNKCQNIKNLNTLNYKKIFDSLNDHVTPLVSHTIINIDDDTVINSLNLEENDEENTEFLKKFIKDKIFEIDNKKYFRDNGTYRRIVEEYEERIKLIWEAHKIGHEGFDKTYQRLKRHYYWKGMSNDVKVTIQLCSKCQLCKNNKSVDATERYATPVEGPFIHLGMDIIGPLPITERNNQYIIVIVDYFTKWVEAEPLATVTSKDVIYFLSRVFARHGTPQVVTTDNGPQFNSELTRIFLDLYDVYIHFSTTYHPETNGMTENRNREIGKYLRLLGQKEKDWDIVLPSALWALRTSRNTATKHSSFELVYGRIDQQPFELATTLPTSNVQATNEEKLLEKFCNHYKWVLEASQNMKKN